MEVVACKRLFNALSNYEEELIIRIWLKYIDEEVSLRKKMIEQCCDGEYYFIEGEPPYDPCDFLAALFRIYKYIENKYLCHLNPTAQSFGNSSFQNRYYGSYGLKSHFESVFKSEHGELTEEHQKNINTMMERLDEELYYNIDLANKDGFFDFENAQISLISKKEVILECIYLSTIIQELIDERKSNTSQFSELIIFNEDDFMLMSDLEKQLYIPYKKNTNYITSNNINDEKQSKKNYTIVKGDESILISQEDEDKYDYKNMVNILEPYISGGSEIVYKSIIEQKVLPEGFPKLRAKTIKKADIYRFSKCFDITISQINKIFEDKIMAKHKPKAFVNNFFSVLKGLNPDFNAPK
jgi:hypothetical protein